MTTQAMTKICSTCNAEKCISEFPPRSGGVRGQCRTCYNAQKSANRKRSAVRAARRRYYEESKVTCNRKSRENEMARRFHYALVRTASYSIKHGYAPCISSEESIREAFTGKCFACGVPEDECNEKLHLDHNHETGAFRGWLCKGCNMALGHLRDSPERARMLAEYIENFT